jgi:hypothetical protein
LAEGLTGDQALEKARDVGHEIVDANLAGLVQWAAENPR